MFKIIEKESLAEDIFRIVLKAPLIADKAAAGQFVVVVADEKSERIPLTLSDWDREKGTITLIFQIVGASTRKLGSFKAGEEIAHLLGPLGHPTKIEKLGEVVCVAGGVGIAEVYPVSRAFKQAGNRVLIIAGARSKGLFILEDKLRSVSDELFITTDDGSYGKRGLVIAPLRELFDSIEKSTHTIFPQLVYAIGPITMMEEVAAFTRGFNIKTVVSVNPIMVDATGMCGACRCTVAGKTVFGCVDGPDFDGHQLDFSELRKRLKLFEEQERSAR